MGAFQMRLNMAAWVSELRLTKTKTITAIEIYGTKWDEVIFRNAHFRIRGLIFTSFPRVLVHGDVFRSSKL